MLAVFSVCEKMHKKETLAAQGFPDGIIEFQHILGHPKIVNIPFGKVQINKYKINKNYNIIYNSVDT